MSNKQLVYSSTDSKMGRSWSLGYSLSLTCPNCFFLNWMSPQSKEVHSDTVVNSVPENNKMTSGPQEGFGAPFDHTTVEKLVLIMEILRRVRKVMDTVNKLSLNLAGTQPVCTPLRSPSVCWTWVLCKASLNSSPPSPLSRLVPFSYEMRVSTSVHRTTRSINYRCTVARCNIVLYWWLTQFAKHCRGVNICMGLDSKL